MIFRTPSLTNEERNALDKIVKLRKDLRHFLATPTRWMGSARRVLGARAIQGSNTIEGYNVSVEDAIAAMEGDEPVEAEQEDWAVVSGYQRAMTYVINLKDDAHFSYSPSLLRSLHFMMTEFHLEEASPGLWRPGSIWVRNDATGEVVYEGPDADDVPGLIDELVGTLEDDTDTPTTVKAAMAHLNLVMIHPFRDGNGRMARCLQTLVLAREQIVSPELCSIEEFLGRNTQSYYEILAEVGAGAWNPKHNARPWVRYCLIAHYIQAESVQRRIRESEQIWMELEGEVERHGLHPRTMGALFDAAIRLRVRNASYRSVLEDWGEEISNQVATSDLRDLVNAGLLEQRGKKRGTFYVAGETIGAIRERAQADRKPITADRLFRKEA